MLRVKKLTNEDLMERNLADTDVSGVDLSDTFLRYCDPKFLNPFLYGRNPRDTAINVLQNYSQGGVNLGVFRNSRTFRDLAVSYVNELRLSTDHLAMKDIIKEILVRVYLFYRSKEQLKSGEMSFESGDFYKALKFLFQCQWTGLKGEIEALDDHAAAQGIEELKRTVNTMMKAIMIQLEQKCNPRFISCYKGPKNNVSTFIAAISSYAKSVGVFSYQRPQQVAADAFVKEINRNPFQENDMHQLVVSFLRNFYFNSHEIGSSVLETELEERLAFLLQCGDIKEEENFTVPKLMEAKKKLYTLAEEVQQPQDGQKSKDDIVSTSTSTSGSLEGEEEGGELGENERKEEDEDEQLQLLRPAAPVVSSKKLLSGSPKRRRMDEYEIASAAASAVPAASIGHTRMQKEEPSTPSPSKKLRMEATSSQEPGASGGLDVVPVLVSAASIASPALPVALSSPSVQSMQRPCHHGKGGRMCEACAAKTPQTPQTPKTSGSGKDPEARARRSSVDNQAPAIDRAEEATRKFLERQKRGAQRGVAGHATLSSSPMLNLNSAPFANTPISRRPPTGSGASTPSSTVFRSTTVPRGPATPVVPQSLDQKNVNSGPQ